MSTAGFIALMALLVTVVAAVAFLVGYLRGWDVGHASGLDEAQRHREAYDNDGRRASQHLVDRTKESDRG